MDSCTKKKSSEQSEQHDLTDEQLLALMPLQMRDDLAAASRALAEQTGTAEGVFRVILNTDALDFARAVLAGCDSANEPG